MGKRIVFTGGSGKAGRHVVPYLLDKGHKVLNVDRAVLDVLTGPLAQALLVAQLYVTHRHLLVCAPLCSASRFAN